MGRESAKYRAHANPTNTHTSPPKPFPPKPFPPGRDRHVRPQAPERWPPSVTLPQLQRQRDARRVIQEGRQGAQAERRASHGSAERGQEGDGGSAQERAQGAGQVTRGKEQGRSSRGGAERKQRTARLGAGGREGARAQEGRAGARAGSPGAGGRARGGG